MDTGDMLRARLSGDLADLDAPRMTSGLVERACEGGRRRLRRRRWARTAGGAVAVAAVAAVAIVAGSGMLAASPGANDDTVGSSPAAPPSTPVTVRDTPYYEQAHALLEQGLSRQGAPGFAGAMQGFVFEHGVQISWNTEAGAIYTHARMERRTLTECPTPDDSRATTDPGTGVTDTVVCSDDDGASAVHTRQAPGAAEPFAITVTVPVEDSVVSITVRTNLEGSGKNTETGRPSPLTADQVKAIAKDPGWHSIDRTRLP
ncbi:hypothetical protein [Yinghuangia sp. YIM S09857]|uniref:hypothetical protein n=1 Tax=Yinghuangia sp. YIM S09857 TaxID=3436929 RepID=UPI003F529219